MALIFTLAIGGLLIPAAVLHGQEAETIIRTETRLALLRFHAVLKNQYVDNLQPEDIQLLEDGKPQKLALFEGPRTAGGQRQTPLEVILLFDVSLSVIDENLLNPAVFKETLLDGLGDRVGISVYAFAARFKRFTAPTRDPEKLKSAFDGVFRFSHAGSPIFQAIMKAGQDASSAGGNVTRLMLVFSDGEDTTKTKPEEAIKAANSLGIQVYPVVLGHQRIVDQAARMQQPPGAGGGNPAAADRQARLSGRQELMQEFASIGPATGGRSFDPLVMNNTVVRALLSSVVKQVRYEYVVGYSPETPGSEKRIRKVQVKLVSKDKGKIEGGIRTVLH
jgi:Ca-activated chloride channel family protein